MSSGNPEKLVLSWFTKCKNSLPLDTESTPIILFTSVNQDFFG